MKSCTGVGIGIKSCTGVGIGVELRQLELESQKSAGVGIGVGIEPRQTKLKSESKRSAGVGIVEVESNPGLLQVFTSYFYNYQKS